MIIFILFKIVPINSSLQTTTEVFLLMSVSAVDDLGVVADHRGAAVDLLVCLLAVLGDDVLALLDVGRVHDGLAHGAGHLPGVLLRHLVALLLHVVVAPGARGVAVGVASILGLSLGLGLPLAVVTSVAVAHHVAVVAHNVGAVVNLFNQKIVNI